MCSPVEATPPRTDLWHRLGAPEGMRLCWRALLFLLVSPSHVRAQHVDQLRRRSVMVSTHAYSGKDQQAHTLPRVS